MDLSVYESIYWAATIIGGGYLVFSALTGQLGGMMDHDAGAGGHDAHVDSGHGAGAHAEAAHEADATGDTADADSDSNGADAFTITSPAIIATFLGMGGICGLLFTQAGIGGAISLLAAGTAGIALAGAALFGLNGLLRRVQGSSHIRFAEATNLEAEVITPIAERGVGEIAFTAKGSRRTGPARSTDGRAIPRGTRVVIVTHRDGHFNVEATVDERLRLLGLHAAESSGEAEASPSAPKDVVVNSPPQQ